MVLESAVPGEALRAGRIVRECVRKPRVGSGSEDMNVVSCLFAAPVGLGARAGKDGGLQGLFGWDSDGSVSPRC